MCTKKGNTHILIRCCDGLGLPGMRCSWRRPLKPVSIQRNVSDVPEQSNSSVTVHGNNTRLVRSMIEYLVLQKETITVLPK